MLNFALIVPALFQVTESRDESSSQVDPLKILPHSRFEISAPPYVTSRLASPLKEVSVCLLVECNSSFSLCRRECSFFD